MAVTRSLPPRKGEKGDTSGKNDFPADGSDGDGDGKKNETKKVTDFSSEDGDDIPDEFQKKHNTDKD